MSGEVIWLGDLPSWSLPQVAKRKKVIARFETIRAAHPAAIWEFHDVSTRFAVKCIIPERYAKWQGRIILESCVPIIAENKGQFYAGRLYTVRGLSMLCARLDGMDWTRFDTMADKARAERAAMEECEK